MRLLGVGTTVRTLAAGPAGASGHKSDFTRFIVDLSRMDRADLPAGAEIIYDLQEINVLVVSAERESLSDSLAATPDLELRQHDRFGQTTLTAGTDIDDNDTTNVDADDVGPVEEHDEDDPPDHPAEPTRRDLQWNDHALSLSEEIHDEVTGEGTRIGIIDTGVFDEHPDLTENVNAELSQNFTDDDGDFRPESPETDHGTHVAGIAAARNDADPEGNTGVVGVAPDTEILALRVFSATGGAATGDILAAVVYAAQTECDAVNLSLGFPAPFVFLDRFGDLLRRVRDLYARAFEFARTAGTVPVTSAGNDGLDMADENVLALPTEAPGAFTVSATGPIGYLWDDEPADEIEPEEAVESLREPTSGPAFYTNYGAVDISASGGNIDLSAPRDVAAEYDLVLSTVAPENGWGYKAGTSMAAPRVVGAIALVRAKAPNARVSQIEELLCSTADDLGEAYHGDGHLNLVGLIDAVEDLDTDSTDE